MLRSRSNALVSVRRVAQVNAGRQTAGIEGRTALLASQKADLADWVQHRSRSWAPKPVRRVYIPKPGGTKRHPLGIPVIADRALQAVIVNALEPEWEARFESRSYGFRPGRGCHDAIEAIYKVGRGPTTRQWVLDADLAAALDRIDHPPTRPARHVPRPGPGRGMVDGGSDREGMVHPDRGGDSPGRVMRSCA
jgi:RNA-directed DNA polymerase